jgi:hypothetical protein
MDDPLMPPRVLTQQYIGKGTLERARKTKLYALSCAVDAILYDASPCDVILGSTVTQSSVHRTNVLVIEAQKYIGDGGVGFFGRDGRYFDVRKALRDVQMELERMALLEATT